MNTKTFLMAFAVASTVHLPSAFAIPAACSVDDARTVGAGIQYTYYDGSMYEVFAEIGKVTDISLHPGEKVTGIVAGDTARWMVETAEIGSRSHVYVKPKEDGLKTNFIINTERRSYHLSFSSGNTFTPIVSWAYPEDTVIPFTVKTDEEKKFDEIYTEEKQGKPAVKTLNRMYEVRGGGKAEKSLFPTEIFDDGTRTYIKIPQNNKYDLPVLYRVDDKNKGKLTLVNYRVRYGYFVADRVFDHARLQFSSKEYVDIRPRKAGKHEDENAD